MPSTQHHLNGTGTDTGPLNPGGDCHAGRSAANPFLYEILHDYLPNADPNSLASLNELLPILPTAHSDIRACCGAIAQGIVACTDLDQMLEIPTTLRHLRIPEEYSVPLLKGAIFATFSLDIPDAGATQVKIACNLLAALPASLQAPVDPVLRASATQYLFKELEKGNPQAYTASLYSPFAALRAPTPTRLQAVAELGIEQQLSVIGSDMETDPMPLLNKMRYLSILAGDTVGEGDNAFAQQLERLKSILGAVVDSSDAVRRHALLLFLPQGWNEGEKSTVIDDALGSNYENLFRQILRQQEQQPNPDSEKLALVLINYDGDDVIILPSYTSNLGEIALELFGRFREPFLPYWQAECLTQIPLPKGLILAVDKSKRQGCGAFCPSGEKVGTVVVSSEDVLYNNSEDIEAVVKHEVAHAMVALGPVVLDEWQDYTSTGFYTPTTLINHVYSAGVLPGEEATNWGKINAETATRIGKALQALCTANLLMRHELAVIRAVLEHHSVGGGFDLCSLAGLPGFSVSVQPPGGSYVTYQFARPDPTEAPAGPPVESDITFLQQRHAQLVGAIQDLATTFSSLNAPEKPQISLLDILKAIQDGKPLPSEIETYQTFLQETFQGDKFEMVQSTIAQETQLHGIGPDSYYTLHSIFGMHFQIAHVGLVGGLRRAAETGRLNAVTIAHSHDFLHGGWQTTEPLWDNLAGLFGRSVEVYGVDPNHLALIRTPIGQRASLLDPELVAAARTWCENLPWQWPWRPSNGPDTYKNAATHIIAGKELNYRIFGNQAEHTTVEITDPLTGTRYPAVMPFSNHRWAKFAEAAIKRCASTVCVGPPDMLGYDPLLHRILVPPEPISNQDVLTEVALRVGARHANVKSDGFAHLAVECLLNWQDFKHFKGSVLVTRAPSCISLQDVLETMAVLTERGKTSLDGQNLLNRCRTSLQLLRAALTPDGQSAENLIHPTPWRSGLGTVWIHPGGGVLGLVTIFVAQNTPTTVPIAGEALDELRRKAVERIDLSCDEVSEKNR